MPEISQISQICAVSEAQKIAIYCRFRDNCPIERVKLTVALTLVF